MCPHSTEKVKKKGDYEGMGGEKGVLVSAVSEDSIRGERPHEGVWRTRGGQWLIMDREFLFLFLRRG